MRAPSRGGTAPASESSSALSLSLAVWPLVRTAAGLVRRLVSTPQGSMKGAQRSLILLVLLAFGSAGANAQEKWLQVGADIDGTLSRGSFGHALAMSTNGRVLAIGAPGLSGAYGHVQVYGWEQGGWVPRGAQFKGKDAQEERSRIEFGWSVALSSDGDILAIGADAYQFQSELSGFVRVFQWMGHALGWAPWGEIQGRSPKDMFGSSIALSYDGTVLAIGAGGDDGNGQNSGCVRVYKMVGEGVWNQTGSDIVGEAASDFAGFAIALSSDGTVVAIGSPANGRNGFASGQARVYEWRAGVGNETGAWAKRGSDLGGKKSKDEFGHSISLSANGSVLVVGAPGPDSTGAGYARVFVWGESDWSQRGAVIDGENLKDAAGWSVDLSASGDILAIGSPTNAGNGERAGHARIFVWEGSDWRIQGLDIDGESAHDFSGTSVALSSDGMILAVGAIENDGGSADGGHSRVYMWQEDECTPNPCFNNATCGNGIDTFYCVCAEGFEGDLCAVETVPPTPPPVSVGALLAAASPGDVVDLPPGLYQGDLNCGLIVDKSVTLRAQNTSQKSVIDCEGEDSRIFLVTGSVHFVIEGIEMKNGKNEGGAGGCIAVESGSSVTIKDGALSSCSASWGGAVSLGAGSSLSLLSSKVSESTALEAGGAVVAGPGATLTLRDSQIAQNSAASGGAFAAAMGSTVSVGEGCSVHGNKAILNSRRSSAGDGLGGALAALGRCGGSSSMAALCSRLLQALPEEPGASYGDTTVSIGNSTLNDNSADLSGGFVAAQGGVMLDFQDTVIERNNAEFGGGVAAVDDVSVSLQRCSVVNNWANRAGGFAVVLQNSTLQLLNTVVQGQRALLGGAVFLSGASTVSASDMQAVENEATTESSGVKGAGGFAVVDSESSALFERSVFRQHAAHVGGVAAATRGGKILASGVDVEGSHADYAGGCLFLLQSEASLIDSRLRGNTAFKVPSDSDVAVGGAIAALADCFISDFDQGMCTNIIESISAVLASSFAFSSVSEPAKVCGEADADSPAARSTLRIEGTSITESRTGVDVMVGQERLFSAFAAGTVFAAGTDVELKSTVLTDNWSARSGAGVALGWGSTMAAVDCVMERNELGGHLSAGAALILYKGSNGTVEGRSVFRENSSPFWGGAIAVESDSSLSLVDALVEENWSDSEDLTGAAINVFAGSSLKLLRSTIVGNSGPGGAVAVLFDGLLTAEDTVFERNDGLGFGGAVSLHQSARAVIRGGRFENNTAHGGGAIGAQGSSDLDVSGAVMASNQATSPDLGGGAVAVVDFSSATVSGSSTLSLNSGQAGGAIYVGGSASLAVSDTLMDHNDASKHGGAIALEAESKGSLGSGTVMERNSAASFGGCLYHVGQEVLVTGSVSMRSCTAGQGGGGMSMLGKVEVTEGTLSLTGNSADGNGGGAQMVGSEALLVIQAGGALHAADNEASADGGGISMSDGAFIEVSSDSCKAKCYEQNSECDPDCFSRSCGWAHATCNEQFTVAQSEVMEPCDRISPSDSCPFMMADLGGENDKCPLQCFTGSCNWGAVADGRGVCKKQKKSMAQCPLFDAAVSYRLNNQVTFAKGGTAQGLARCKDPSACNPPSEVRASSEFSSAPGAVGSGGLGLNSSMREWGMVWPSQTLSDGNVYESGCAIEAWVRRDSDAGAAKRYLLASENLAVGMLGGSALFVEVQGRTVASTLPHAVCGSGTKVTKLSEQAGVITTGDEGNDEHADCSWVISGPHQSLTLTFASFNTSEGIGFLSVYSCSNQECTCRELVDLLSGDAIPPSMTLNDVAAVSVVFRAGGHRSKGFTIVYESEAVTPPDNSTLAPGALGLLPGAQHHIAVSIPAGGDPTFFLDGVELWSGTLPAWEGSAASRHLGGSWGVAIGRSHPGDVPKGHWHGAVDEVRIWGRALEAQEVTQNMPSGCDDMQAATQLFECFGFEPQSIEAIGSVLGLSGSKMSVFVGDKHLPWCVDLNDDGLVLESKCEMCVEPEVVSESWGFCQESSAAQPKLPGAGFDYDLSELASLRRKSLSELFTQFPGCGSVAVRISGNVAGMNGGGLHQSSCNGGLEARDVCFIGGMAPMQGAETAVFESNEAKGAGGAVFTSCSSIGASCEAVLSESLDFVDWVEPKVTFRNNKADAYGDSVATLPASLQVSNLVTGVIPGQDPIDMDVRLLDGMGQAVAFSTSGPILNPHVVQIVVCRAGEVCTVVDGLVPAKFHPLVRGTGAAHTADRPHTVVCIKGSSSVDMRISVTGSVGLNLTATRSLECLPCEEEQMRREAEDTWWCVDPANKTTVVVEREICPVVGLQCPDLSCAVLSQDGVLECPGDGETKTPVLGEWSRNGQDQYLLVACPVGYSRINSLGGVPVDPTDASFSLEAQRCKLCHNKYEYVLDPNMHACQRCPEGLICDGTSNYTARLRQSLWEADGGVLKLRSCPKGHFVSSGDGVADEDQACKPCPAGTHCTKETCVERQCEACPAGYYKESDGSYTCQPCPPSTYNAKNGSMSASDCLECPGGSRAQGMANANQSVCKCSACSLGGFCRDAMYQVPEPNFPDIFPVCNVCPAGARCDGVSLQTYPSIYDSLGARWEPEGSVPGERKLYLKECPLGTRLVNDTGYENQACLPCPEGMYVNRSDVPGYDCEPCPRSAVCPNGRLIQNGVIIVIPLTVDGLTIQDLTSPSDSEALFALRTSLAELAGLDVSFVTISSIGSSRRSLAVEHHNGRRQSVGPRSVFFNAFATSEAQGQAISQTISDPSFSERLGQLLARLGVSHLFVEVSMQDVSVPTPAPTPRPTPSPTPARTPAPTPAPDTSGQEGWIYEYDPRTGKLRLVGCPVGYLVVNSTIQSQTCMLCPPATVSLSAYDNCEADSAGKVTCAPRECNACPAGLYCAGGAHYKEWTEGSVWVQVNESTASGNGTSQRLRVDSCPEGFVLVRSESHPTQDRCKECPIGTYSVTRSTFDPSLIAAESAGTLVRGFDLCMPCPPGADCHRAQVKSREDFWMGSQMICPVAEEACNDLNGQCDPGACFPLEGRREEVAEKCGPSNSSCRVVPMIYMCPPSMCVQEEDESSDVAKICRDGHGGPVCAVCEEGWAMETGVCIECGERGASPFILAAILGLFTLWFLYYFSWRTLLFKSETEPGCVGRMLERVTGAFDSSERSDSDQGTVWNRFWRVASKAVPRNTTGYWKTLIGFWQVAGSFGAVFEVAWPHELRQIWQVLGSLVTIDWLEFPGLACITRSITFQERVIESSLVIPGLCLVLALPVLVTLLQLRASRGDARSKALHSDTIELFFFAALFVIFCAYPASSRTILSVFSCQSLGADGTWLRSDYQVTCPEGSEFIFTWAALFAVIIPLGAPLLMIALMYYHNIPRIARNKRDHALIQAVCERYRTRMNSKLVSQLVSSMANPAGNLDRLKSRSNMMQSSVEQSRKMMMLKWPSGSTWPLGRNTSGPPKSGPSSDGTEPLSPPLIRAGDKPLASLDAGSRTGSLAAVCKDIGLPEGIEEEVHELLKFALPLGKGCTMGVEELGQAVKLHEETLNYAWQQVVGGCDPPKTRKVYLVLYLFVIRQLAEHERQCDTMYRGAWSERDQESQEEDEDDGVGEAWESSQGLGEGQLRERLIGSATRMEYAGMIRLQALSWSGDTEEECSAIDRLGFLIGMYHPLLWWWDIFDTLRKLIMAAVLIFGFPGRASQLGLGLFTTLGSLLMALAMWPFRENEIGTMYCFSLLVQAITLMLGMFLITHQFSELIGLDGQQGRLALSVLLIVLHFATLFVPFVHLLLIQFFMRRGKRSLLSGADSQEEDESGSSASDDNGPLSTDMVHLHEAGEVMGEESGGIAVCAFARPPRGAPGDFGGLGKLDPFEINSDLAPAGAFKVRNGDVNGSARKLDSGVWAVDSRSKQEKKLEKMNPLEIKEALTRGMSMMPGSRLFGRGPAAALAERNRRLSDAFTAKSPEDTPTKPATRAHSATPAQCNQARNPAALLATPGSPGSPIRPLGQFWGGAPTEEAAPIEETVRPLGQFWADSGAPAPARSDSPATPDGVNDSDDTPSCPRSTEGAHAFHAVGDA